MAASEYHVRHPATGMFNAAFIALISGCFAPFYAPQRGSVDYVTRTPTLFQMTGDNWPEHAHREAGWLVIFTVILVISCLVLGIPSKLIPAPLRLWACGTVAFFALIAFLMYVEQPGIDDATTNFGAGGSLLIGGSIGAIVACLIDMIGNSRSALNRFIDSRI